jgi:hypothetical protein
LQLADQSIRHPVGIAEDIPVRIMNSFVHVNFMVIKMDVFRQIPLILRRSFLSTTGATIDVATRIIKLNISRKEDHKVQQSHGHDQKPSAAENFSTKFSRRVKNATPVVTRSLVAPTN